MAVAVATLGVAGAAPRVIGTVTAGGAFRLNGDTVLANGTVTEGAVLDAGSGASSVRFTGGARLVLGAGSRGKLFSDRILLEKGETRLDNGSGFRVEALGLAVHADGAISTGRIGLVGRNRLRVAALTGSLRVLNTRGVLVGNIAAGSALAFEPQAPAATGIRITGTLTQQNGHFLLTDQVTHVTMEITGPGLSAHVGHVVQVTGTVNASATPVAEASQVVAATSVKTVTAGGPGTGGAAAAGAGGASGAAIGVTTVAVIGGVAVAATLGGLAASGTFSGQSPLPSESR